MISRHGALVRPPNVLVAQSGLPVQSLLDVIAPPATVAVASAYGCLSTCPALVWDNGMFATDFPAAPVVPHSGSTVYLHPFVVLSSSGSSLVPFVSNLYFTRGILVLTFRISSLRYTWNPLFLLSIPIRFTYPETIRQVPYTASMCLLLL